MGRITLMMVGLFCLAAPTFLYASVLFAQEEVEGLGLLDPSQLKGSEVNKSTLMSSEPLGSDSVKVVERSTSKEDWAGIDLGQSKTPIRLQVIAGARDFYFRAFRAYSIGDYPDAIMLFERYLKRFANDVDADNAQYYIGESLYRQGMLPEAEKAFVKVIAEYQQGDTKQGFRTADSIYMLGRIQHELGFSMRAAHYWKRLTELFPETRSAKKANSELANLKVKP